MFQAAFDKIKEKTNQQNQYPSYSQVQQRAADQSEENRATGLIKKVGQAGAAAGRMMNPTQGGGSGGATYSGRLSATLVALDLISGKAERTLVIPETPFRFTLGGKAAPGPVPASTPTPSDMRKV